MNDREPKVLLIQEPVIIRVLAAQLEIRPPQILKELMERDMFTTIDATIPRAVAESILKAHGVKYSFIAD